MMTLKPELQRKLIQAVANCMVRHADELVMLDQAIGDGDHGLNMKRGFEAVLADLDKTVALPTADALKAVGMALVMKVGGASGPLYGTLFMSLGKALPQEPSTAGLAEAVAAAVAAVKLRGKSDAGAKTLLDVLVPLLEVLREGGDGLPGRLRACATASAAATVPMRAARGRASFLGDRSIGHMDPGARSSELMIHAIVDVLEQEGAV
jgi:dihydroxyacetone kinase-like protein